MIQKMKKALIAVLAVSAIALPVFAMPMSAAAADINNSLGCGATLNVENADGSSCTSDDATFHNLQELLNLVINVFSLVVGVIAVIMIIVGGLRYITSGGDSSKVGGAKTTIIYALVGLVIVALAQLIVHFVLSQANNVITSGQ